jgi:hypothetical protein
MIIYNATCGTVLAIDAEYAGSLWRRMRGLIGSRVIHMLIDDVVVPYESVQNVTDAGVWLALTRDEVKHAPAYDLR